MNHEDNTHFSRPPDIFITGHDLETLSTDELKAHHEQLTSLEAPLRTQTFEDPDLEAVSKMSYLAARSIVGEKAATQQLKDYERSTNQAHKREVEDLHRIARTDSLTGLPNRVAFAEALETASKSGRPYGVIYIDLNGFKYVNDRHGHDGGDRILQIVGDKLQDRLRTKADPLNPEEKHDVVVRLSAAENHSLLAEGEADHEEQTLFEQAARLGGDEFAAVVFLDPRPHNRHRLRAENPAKEPTLDERMQAITRHLSLDISRIGEENPDTVGTDFGAAIGYSIVKPYGDPVAALKEADSMMYTVKNQRRKKPSQQNAQSA